MTMVPSPNLLQQHYHTHGGCAGPRGDGASASYSGKYMMIGSDLFGHMADDGSSANSFHAAAGPSKETQEVVGDDVDERDLGWLQLGIGSHTRVRQPDQGKGLIELNLLSDHAAPFATIQSVEPTTDDVAAASISSKQLYFAQQVGANWSFVRQPPPPPEVVWGPYNQYHLWNPMVASSSSSSFWPFYSHTLPHPYTIDGSLLNGASPSSGMKVVDPPSRSKSDVWFALQASQNQGKEPLLPQIQKSYLRIKDGKMTVRLLMKYISNKLGLTNESEVQITCREHQLSPLMTLQYVRDNIWCSADEATTFLSDSPTANHVMILQYKRA